VQYRTDVLQPVSLANRTGGRCCQPSGAILAGQGTQPHRGHGIRLLDGTCRSISPPTRRLVNLQSPPPIPISYVGVHSRQRRCDFLLTPAAGRNTADNVGANVRDETRVEDHGRIPRRPTAIRNLR
jgi:hypothetical protein